MRTLLPNRLVALLAVCLFVAVFATVFVLPSVALAFPFGGQASLVHSCWNQVIYVILGPPIGGPFIWSRSTRTYQFGPPDHAGQWFLGLAGVPYHCVYTIKPVDVRSGSHIFMMGSSQ